MSLLSERRKDFPVLDQQVHQKPLVYLDNAATTQKPFAVINALTHYYSHDNSNVRRSVHTLSHRATTAYENSREKIRDFIHAEHIEEIIFTRGTTEAINLVAQSYGRTFLKPGDEIIVSMMEHHANIVPWQLICEQTGAVLKVIPINNSGELLLDEYRQGFTAKTKLVAITHVSNALGTINPIKEMIAFAHQQGALVLIDGAQAAAHIPINVVELDCDFYAFSGHKMLGPTGIGVLYGKKHLLEKMPPYQGGGEMIKMVSFSKTIYNDLPYKFEAGTPPIASAIGLGAAIDYLQQIGFETIAHTEHELLKYATQQLSAIPGLTLIGTAKQKISILSFILDFAHAHDVGTILDSEGIAVRSGHHCAMPTMEFFGVAATVRASFTFYNTFEEIDKLVKAIEKVRSIFGDTHVRST